jgi:cell wall-associated protease
MKILILLLCLVPFTVFAERYVVEFEKPLHEVEIKKLRKSGFNIELLAHYSSSYFKRTYLVQTDKVSIKKLKVPHNNFSVENVFNPTMMTVVPSSHPERLVKDELFPYQWNLLNQNQMILREISPIETKSYPALVGQDIGWGTVVKNNNINFPVERKVVVAILDTGLDYLHPELRSSLYFNESECNQKNDPIVDVDKNGFAGDCLGWNFTQAKDAPRARDVMDFSGHGTHLAGIISAKNDGLGITGISSQIQLLPLKVIMEDSLEQSAQIAFSDRIAAALIYAIKRGAHVINMSLGWPRSLDTKYLREAITAAQSAGILIVAAAGNNNSDEPIFPCAYEGVVCSGASTLDGKVASFSNFGSTVDVLAPGESILSTYPGKITPDVFHVPGYEFKSGTSQAAPLVSGILAWLKAKFPDDHPLEILSRLYLTTEKIDTYKKNTTYGLVKMDKAHDFVLSSYIKPQIKLLRQIIFSKDQTSGEFTLPLLSHTRNQVDNIQVSIESLSPQLEITSNQETLLSLRPFEGKLTKWNYKIKDIDADAMIKLKITLEYSGVKRVYLNQIPLIRDIRQDSSIKKLPFVFIDKPLPIGRIDKETIKTNINTVESYFPTGQYHYFLRKTVEKGEGENKTSDIELYFFERSENQIIQKNKTVVLPFAKQIINIIKLDANYDGQDDFMIQYVYENKTDKKLAFHFLNDSLEPLFGEFSTWYFKPEVSVINYLNLRFLKGFDPKMGHYPIMVYKEKGMMPESEQDQSPWATVNRKTLDRLYFLEPMISNEGVNLVTKLLTDTSFENDFKSQFSISWKDSINLIHIQTQSKDSFNKNLITALFMVQSSKAKKYYQVHFSKKGSWSASELKVGFSSLENMSMKPMVNLVTDETFDVFWGQMTQDKARFIKIDQEKVLDSFFYSHHTKSDQLISAIASFEKAQESVHFFQSKNELIALTKNSSGQIVDSKNILRFSFLPGRFMSEFFYPIWTNEDNDKTPALYIDTTEITGNRLSVLQVTDGQLKTPAKFSIFISSNCKALNPIMKEDQSTYSIELLCFEKDNWILRSFDLL